MRPELMHPLTKRELEALKTPAKNELLSFVRNQAQIITGAAERIIRDCDVEKTPKDQGIRIYAELVTNQARTLAKELEALLKVNPNDNLGAHAEVADHER